MLTITYTEFLSEAQKTNEGANTKAGKSPNNTHQLYATPEVTCYALQLI